MTFDRAGRFVDPFSIDAFRNGHVTFQVLTPPVSSQNKYRVKQEFKNAVRNITGASKYIITGTCWVAIDYYCQHIKRMKNPGVYDMDNIVKPILDSLVGSDGLLLDDVLIDRVTVNWVDTHESEYLELEIRYPDLIFVSKSKLKIVKSKSGWCFPIDSDILTSPEMDDLLNRYFSNWNSITTESQYTSTLPYLPLQQFIYFNKIKDRGYDFVPLENEIQ